MILFRPRLTAVYVVTAVCVASAGRTASAGLVTHVDFTDFGIRLNQAADTAGATRFSSAEQALIEQTILDNLQTAYAGYTVSFSRSSAGARETLRLGGTTTESNLLGIAAGIDYRNRSDDTADVFTGNFGRFIESSDPRSRQIAELSTALSGTAAHELGHNLGLLHQDSFGNRGFTHTGLGGPSNAGGAQNQRLMATGSTGLSEGQRESLRSFSDLSRLKLEFADGLTAAGPTPNTAETSASHGTFGTAQVVSLATQAVSGFDAANIVGAISTAFEDDFFAFDLTGSGFLTLATITNGLANGVDTVLTVFDSNGTVIGETDDTGYNGSLFGESTDPVALDSLLLGLRVEGAGRYFALVEGFSNDTGDYEFLVGFDADAPAAVPEPATIFFVLAAGTGGVAVRRRRRRLAG